MKNHEEATGPSNKNVTTSENSSIPIITESINKKFAKIDEEIKNFEIELDEQKKLYTNKQSKLKEIKQYVSEIIDSYEKINQLLESISNDENISNLSNVSQRKAQNNFTEEIFENGSFKNCNTTILKMKEIKEKDDPCFTDCMQQKIKKSTVIKRNEIGNTPYIIEEQKDLIPYIETCIESNDNYRNRFAKNGQNKKFLNSTKMTSENNNNKKLIDEILILMQINGFKNEDQLKYYLSEDAQSYKVEGRDPKKYELENYLRNKYGTVIYNFIRSGFKYSNDSN